MGLVSLNRLRIERVSLFAPFLSLGETRFWFRTRISARSLANSPINNFPLEIVGREQSEWGEQREKKKKPLASNFAIYIYVSEYMYRFPFPIFPFVVIIYDPLPPFRRWPYMKYMYMCISIHIYVYHMHLLSIYREGITKKEKRKR